MSVSRRGRPRPCAAVAALVLMLASPSVTDADTLRSEQHGVVIQVGTEHLRAGQASRLQVDLHEAVGGVALTGLRPAAWLVARDPVEAIDVDDRQQCLRKTRTLLGGGLFARPERDLNGYDVLMLDEGPVLTAIEPNFGFGGSRILADVDLAAPAYDWTLDATQRYVYLSLGDVGQVARLDLNDWSLVAAEIAGDRGPPSIGRLRLDPDGQYLWLAIDGGVIALNTADMSPAVRITTHASFHSPPSELAFSADGRRLFVGHRQARRLAVIDLAAQHLLPPIELDGTPTSMAYSALARRLYVTLDGVAEDGRGSIVAIDGLGSAAGRRLSAPPGPTLIRFAGEGRWGLVAHSNGQRLSILDSAQDRIIQSARLEGQPDQIAFSDELAYLRLHDRTQLNMVPLAAVGRAGEAIPTFDTVGGDRGFVNGFRSLAAEGIAATPAGNAVLIANPGDGTVYFYKEGLAAPMGQLDIGGRRPRAVLAIDRSLRERSADGRYETVVDLPASGDYTLVLFVDAPRLVHCVPLRIEAAVQEASDD